MYEENEWKLIPVLRLPCLICNILQYSYHLCMGVDYKSSMRLTTIENNKFLHSYTSRTTLEHIIQEYKTQLKWLQSPSVRRFLDNWELHLLLHRKFLLQFY